MDVSIKFTVLFDGMFWVGIFEKTSKGNYEVYKTIFGSEPKDSEVFNFISVEYKTLKFSNSISANKSKDKKINPKRLQRIIKKETQSNGVGTKAQLAMKLQHEINKVEAKKKSKKKKEDEKCRQFKLSQQKRKRKHKGH